MASIPSLVIELSDSDGSDGEKPRSESRGPEHVAPGSSVEWVRRSTRPRKASMRFSPDEEAAAPQVKRSGAGASAVKKNVAGSPVVPSTTTRHRDHARRTSCNSESSSNSSNRMELVDPQVLISYVEKFKRKIQPGKFGINMPVGPGEFVLVDAVDYLRNLGYADVDESEQDEEEQGVVEEEEEEEEGEEEEEVEEEADKTDYMDNDRFIEEVLFESQSAESEEKPKPEVNFWDRTSRDFVIPSLLPKSHDDTSDCVSNKSTEGSIDVEALDPSTFNLNQSDTKLPIKFPPKKKGRFAITRFTDDEDVGKRRTHNMMEQTRRRDLANQFANLSSLVYSSDHKPIPKVKILSGAADLIAQLKRQLAHLEAREKSYKQTNEEMKKLRDHLSNMLKVRESMMNKPNSNQHVKNYVNSL